MKKPSHFPAGKMEAESRVTEFFGDGLGQGTWPNPNSKGKNSMETDIEFYTWKSSRVSSVTLYLATSVCLLGNCQYSNFRIL